MLGKNRGRVLHSRRKPKTVVPISEPVQQLLDLEVASAVPNKLGSELSLLRFADSVEPSMLWEVLKCKRPHPEISSRYLVFDADL
jgi:hypothetical protein